MHVVIEQARLQAATDAVAALVERTAGPMPVIQNVLIEATNDGVFLKGTDIESHVEVRLAGKVTKPGRTTVPADTFRDIIRLLPPQAEVTLIEDARRVQVKSSGNEYKLMTIPAEDFPEWSRNTEKRTHFNYAQTDLKKLIESVVYALPTKDHRRVLLGVLFEVYDNTLRLTATDGKKLARVEASLPEVEGPAEMATVLPRKLLENLCKHMGGVGSVDVWLATKQASFSVGQIKYEVNAIEGKYPDVGTVIPKEFAVAVMINRDVFLQGAKRAGVTTDEKNKSIILRFEDGAVTFTSTAHDLGAYSGQIPLEYDGPTVEMAFNYQFLSDTLSRFDKPEVVMHIKNATAPVVFKAKDSESALRLLMPIKLADLRAPAAEEGEEE